MKIKLTFPILYYSIADLIKCRSITYSIGKVIVEKITPSLLIEIGRI